MTTKTAYRWPTKLKKFGITDPFLKILAAKYEREIPWQTEVRDNETLHNYVAKELLPSLLSKITYPPEEFSRSFYITRKHVNLESALNYAHDIDPSDMADVRQTLNQQSEGEATELLVEKINLRKAESFKAWTELLKKKYSRNPAFQLLLLRPIFDLTGHGSRRELLKPVLDILEWLHHRIKLRRLLPSENMARLYCVKVGSGVIKMPDNGWRLVQAGTKNAGQLAALCRSSGWCVAGEGWAKSYLAHSNFYILYSEGQPVVALRNHKGSRQVVECQGRSNYSPTEWFQDIQLFLETRDFLLTHRESEMEKAVATSSNIDQKPFKWWQKRISLWPFAIFFAPSHIREKLMPGVRQSIIYYAEFHDFETLKDLIDLPANLGIDKEYWIKLVQTDPTLYLHCPQSEKKDPAVREACIRGWAENLEDFDVTLTELETIPNFVHTSQEFLAAIRDHFPSALRDKIRRHKGTWYERDNPFWIDNVLPYVPEEPKELTIERMVNILLNNENGIFADYIFPETIRERDDFAALRVEAWLSAILASSPLRFGLPEDLKKKKEFKPVPTKPKRVDLKTWIEKVLEKPWLLTQKSGVPKTIRHDKKILEAYRTGWEGKLDGAPWQIWFQYRAGTRRMYMSYALLADEHIIRILASAWQRWRDNGDRIFEAWGWASHRMRILPSYQLAILNAIGSTPDQPLSRGDYKVCEDIREERSQLQRPMCSLDERIETLLKGNGEPVP